MTTKKDFAFYRLKYRDGKGLHTEKFLLASSAMAAYAEAIKRPDVVTAAWFSAGGHCFASYSKLAAQGVLRL